MSDQKALTNDNPQLEDEIIASERPKCGIVMPISSLDGLTADHWQDVRAILHEAIESAGFEAELVSETEESTIIHKTIVHNLYNNPIVVCDVSGKNPNVMFELGMRLTFDRPTVVVKDDETDYSFDMSPIEHVGYPRNLRFHQIVQFKEKLAAKVKATYDAGVKDPNYSTFLKHFGQFTVPKLDQKEVSLDQFIIQRLEELTQSISRLEGSAHSTSRMGLESSGGSRMFWKTLSSNDVSTTSSPGQIIIPIRFLSFFEPLQQTKAADAGGKGRQWDSTFRVDFTDGTFTQSVQARCIVYEPETGHPRQNTEVRFTFRDRAILERLSVGDILIFKQTGLAQPRFRVERYAPSDAQVSVLVNSGARYGWLS